MIPALLAALALAAPVRSTAVDDPCLDATRDTAVTMATTDHATVYGVETGTGTLGVVLVHQYLSDHCEWMDFAHELAAAGDRAIAIDLRGNGASSGGAPGRYDRDVIAAAKQLRAEGATKVVLVGASMGATAVLVAASELKPAATAVVSLSAPARYRALDALFAVRHSHVPVRFLASRLDQPFASDARRLMRAAVAKDKAVAVYPGARHGSSVLDVPRAKAFVLAFLEHAA
jgi:alpha-beta hydrolase superfamily lysophospholipase